ncbi:serine hydrolase domain-containing protein [Portibacter lacus]|uniref:serine hydrolase domain-containing protein n=1 Tax=Portibacter lacus TaxID=1099794 RepID=UPI0032B00E00
MNIFAKPHKKIGGKWIPQSVNKKYYNAIPAGGVNASIEDMSKVMRLLLGNFPSTLADSTISILTTPIIDTKVKYRYYKKWENFDKSYYGYGWRIHTFKDPTTGVSDTLIHHGGQVNNYRSEIAIDRKNGIAICVLFNSYTPLANTVIPKLLEIVKAIHK